MRAPATEPFVLPALLERLEANVESEIAVQTAVQELLDRQLAVLLEGRVPELGSILEEAEQRVARSAELERERADLLERVASALGLDTKSLTLARIGEMVEAGGERWIERSGELRATLERIQETNRKVSLLLRHSVLFLEDLIGVLAGREPNSTRTYDDRGRVEPSTGGHLSAEC